MGIANIQTIDRFFLNGKVDPNWSPYYLQTSGFWAGDTYDGATAYYKDSGHDGLHNYYDFSTDTVPNVTHQGRTDTIGTNDMVVVTIDLAYMSDITQILFATYMPTYPYGISGTVTVLRSPLAIGGSSRGGVAQPKVYTAAMLKANNMTWVQLQSSDQLAMLEIINSTNAHVTGLEIGNAFRYGYVYRITYNIPPRV